MEPDFANNDPDCIPDPRQLLESLPALIWVAHPDGTFNYLSAPWSDYTGRSVSELLGKGWMSVVHPDDLARILDIIQPAGADRVASADYRLRRHDGQWRWFRVQAAPVRAAGGRLLYWSGLSMDLTEYRQIENELRDIQADLKRAQAVTQTGSWRYDIRTNILTGSDEARRVFEHSFGAPFIYEAFLNAVHPEDRDNVSRKWEAALRGEPYDFEHRILVSGKVKWVRGRAQPEFDEHHAVRSLFGTVQDVTERKQVQQALQESETRLKLAQQAGRIGIFEWDCKTDKHYWSEETQAIHGVHKAEVTTAFVLDCFHPDDRNGFIADRCRRFPDRLTHLRNDFRIIRPDGEVRWIDSRVLVMADETGQQVRQIGTLIDITDRKRTEEALREADRRKDEFLAMLAHELRNPLTPIRNAIYLLNKSDDPLVRRHRDIIDRQIRHMTRLLDDLLDVSRVTRGLIALRKQPTPLSRIVSQALEISEPHFTARHHTLHADLPHEDLLIEADPDRIVQVVGNLLTNAANYTPEGGEIWLTVRPEAREAVIRVRDNGIGIDRDTLPHVFELFIQANRSLDRSQGGLGIGLTIVETMVKLHGGTVEAHSEGLGHGSEFVVRLPLLPAVVAAAPGIPKAAPPAASGKKILVVEDMPDTAASLAEILKQWGHEVQVAYDGEQALSVLAGFKPDVILLDIGLPKLDGYEVARRVRQGFDRRIRIVSLTGYGELPDQTRAQTIGIHEQLLKPVDLETLQRLLARS